MLHQYTPSPPPKLLRFVICYVISQRGIITMVRQYRSPLSPAATTWRENGSLAAVSLPRLTSTLNTFATLEVVLGFSFFLIKKKKNGFEHYKILTPGKVV